MKTEDDEQGEGSVSRKRQPLLLCPLLAGERADGVPARGGRIELQIARGQMDTRPWTNSRSVVATEKETSERPWKSSEMSVRADLMPPHPSNLDSTAASFSRILAFYDLLLKKKKRKRNKIFRNTEGRREIQSPVSVFI